MVAIAEAMDFTVADALRKFAPHYIARYGKRMPPHHRKVLGLIIRCKTGELGNVIYRCPSCQARHWVGRSCGNRHCPNCQTEKTQQWLAKQTSKLLPVQHFVVTFTVPKELRPLLRGHPEIGYEAIFSAGSKTIRKAGLYGQLPPGVLKFDWVVNIKPVGNGQAVLKYLAPYVYRVAICDNRILSVDEQGVSYRVKPSGKRAYKTRHLDGESFVRAFTQHILPPGFRKVRYYGFMSANCGMKLADARWLIWLWRGWTYYMGSQVTSPVVSQRKPPKCDRCGGALELAGITNSQGKWIWRRAFTIRGPPEQSQAAGHGKAPMS